MSKLDDINPEDIERIEVIKGPSAATLYGTEASNGVINIITKRGVEGAPQFDLTIKQGATWLPNARDQVGVAYGKDSGATSSPSTSGTRREMPGGSSTPRATPRATRSA